jgi:hypothetical protein
MRLAKTLLIGALASAALACTGGVTIPTIPPIPTFPGIPSIPPIDIPSGALPSPGSVACTLLTVAEANTIMGGNMQDLSTAATDCTFLDSSTFASLSLSLTSGGGIAGIKFLANGGEDMAIAGFPAYYVNFAGDQMYVEKNNQTLFIFAVGQTDKRDQLIAAANIAITRF